MIRYFRSNLREVILRTRKVSGQSLPRSKSSQQAERILRQLSSIGPLFSTRSIHQINFTRRHASTAASSFNEILSEIRQWQSSPPTQESMSSLFRSVQYSKQEITSSQIEEILDTTSKIFNSLKPESLSMVLYWASKINISKPAFLSELSSQILSHPVSSYPQRHLCLIIHSCSLIARHKGMESEIEDLNSFFPGMAELIDQVAREITSPTTLPQLKESELASSINGLGLLKYSNSEILNPLLRQAESPDALPRFLERELSNILNGMASLKLTRHPSLDGLAAEVIEKDRLRVYKEQELCSILASLADLRYGNEDAIGVLLAEAFRTSRIAAYTESQLSTLIYSLDKLQVSDQRLWRVLIRELSTPERLPGFKEHHLANALYSIGQCQYKDESALQRILDEVAKKERIEKYSTKDFSLMLYGMTRVNYRSPVVLRMMSQELSKPGRLLEKGLTDKTLSGLMLSMATLRHRDPELVQKYLTDILHPSKLQNMDIEVLAEYIFCLGKFRVPLAQGTEEVVRTLMEKSKAADLSHRGLGMVIYGLGQFGPESLEFAEPIAEALEEEIGKVERFSIQDLAMIVYSFGLMKLCKPDLVNRFVDAFTRPDRLHRASTQHLSNFMYGIGQLRHKIGPLAHRMIESELKREDRLKTYTGQEIANLVFSISLLSANDKTSFQQVVQKLVAEAVRPERLSRLQEMELTCLLSGLKKLKVRDVNILVPVLEEITLPPRLANLKNGEISEVMDVISQLGVCPDELTEKLLLEARKPERIESFDVSSAVTMVYSLGKLQNQNYPETIKSFADKLTESEILESLEEPQLAKLLYGLTYSRYDSADAFQLVFEEAVKHHRLGKFSCIDVLSIMHCILALRDRGMETDELIRAARVFAIEMTSSDRITWYTPSQLTQVLSCLGSLRNKNVATVFPILKEMAIPEKLPQISPSEISKAVFAVGPLAFVSQKLHPQLALAVKPILKQVVLNGVQSMDCHSMMELVVGMSMLGLNDAYILDNLSVEMIKPARLKSFRAWHISKIFYAIGQIRYNNLDLIRALARELSKPDRAQRLDYRHWSNIFSAVMMLKFKDEEFAKVIEKQIAEPEKRRLNIN